MEHFDYDGRRFSPVSAGLDGRDPAIGLYHQQADLVWAEFSGPNVLIGRLVGTCGPDGVIDATYCMVTRDGRTAAGACISTPTLLPDGRIHLHERWRRLDGTSGESHIEEVAE